MAVRPSITHRTELEEFNGLSALDSPLRQGSSMSRVAEPAKAAENGDKTENHQCCLEKKRLEASKAEQRRSLGLEFVSKMSNPDIDNGMTMCMKLSAENKINVKNAFSLGMIDFMTYMIKKHNGKLQVESIWLDVSAKIYGLRVDSVHTDTLKMIGSLDEQEKSDGKFDSGLGAENSDPGVDSDVERERTLRAKKKKSKHKILASAESLRAPLDLISPASLMIDEPDSQTTEMLFQAILPVHANSDLYLHPYDDVILDTVNPEREADVNNAPVDCPLLERFGHLDLCPSFAKFEFLGWSAEEGLELAPDVTRELLVENHGFQFDPEASLPTDDEPASSGMNYVEMEDDDNENIEVHDTRNMHSILQRYSAENIVGSRIVEGCTQESIKHSVDAVVIFDEESMEAALDKFEIVAPKLVRLDRKTMKVAWSEEKITSLSDLDYDDLQWCRYYLHPEVIKKLPHKDEKNGTFLPVEVGDYDDNNNENDTCDYCCSNIETEDHQTGNDENCYNGADLEEDVAIATQGFAGVNLVEAPTMTKRIFIPFSQRAKKIDMRDLKRAMWENLISTEGDEETVDGAEAAGDNNADKINGSKNFCDVFKNLPNVLAKSNAEALSIPIAFISLLHLANEKTLQIDSSDDKTDLHIHQG